MKAEDEARAGFDFDTFCLTALGTTPGLIRNTLQGWLDEDAGHGDATLRAMGVLGARPALARVTAKEPCVATGVPLAAEVLALAHGGNPSALGSRGAGLEVVRMAGEGQKLAAGEVVLEVKGLAAALLLGERSCLNLLARLCGIATHTAAVVERLREIALAPGRARPLLLETRKTTPGLKIFEKYATRCGGAANHRMGLDAGAMLKENHIRLAMDAGYGLPSIIKDVKLRLPLLTGLEVEVTCLQEFEQALAAGAEVIMLDNFSLEDVAAAVAIRDKSNARALLEISGNLDRRPLEAIVATGVDVMSMGALIHQARWSDLSMTFETP